MHLPAPCTSGFCCKNAGKLPILSHASQRQHVQVGWPCSTAQGLGMVALQTSMGQLLVLLAKLLGSC